MDPAVIATYHFDFGEGLNRRGTYVRTAPHIDGGCPHRFGFVLDDVGIVLPLGTILSPELADLVDICSAIRVADGRAPRGVCGETLLPRRKMHAVIGIRRVSLWSQPAVRDAFEELLAWLAHDDWTFEFVPRPSGPSASGRQMPLLSGTIPHRPIVALHSGGMDSCLGLIEALICGEAEAVVAVSLVTHPRIGRPVRFVLDKLQAARNSGEPKLFGLELGLHHASVNSTFADRESSQRTRILPCLAAGLGVAAMTGSDELRITENGVGAINLRYIPGQLGGAMNRAMHPRTLHTFASIASLIAGRPFRIVNDGFFRTKAQLLSERVESRFIEAIRTTVSCERLPWYPAGHSCGTCASCLLRRVTLRAAELLGIDDVVHQQVDVDLLTTTIDLRQDKAVPLLAFEAQAAELHLALKQAQPYRALRARFPELIDLEMEATALGLDSRMLQAAVVQLYRRHVREWDHFAALVPALGRASVQLPLPLVRVPVAAAG